ncbi:glycosyl transferase [Cystobacter fuscus]|uniref:Glycosyl transferase n=1 Tax=Cystobacter fuscus TaxID=43 RepID=A0A250J3F4_9BACT|nr:ceramide glucosyltransferase [Cystobacter fuscus]ATB38028.1 glycosyl transferase [Cystobacter fuscus]
MFSTHAIGLALLVAAALGSFVLCVQLFCVWLHHRRLSHVTPESNPSRPLKSISILKPLCGVDDDLEANLECFATLDYPAYELLLGVKDTRDAAYPVAQAAVARWPHRVRLVVQQGEPGLNPKVNQLITLAAAARNELLLISDSNTRVEPDYLEEISHTFEDPRVGCMSHPISGVGDQTLGSLMDNLYQCTSAGAGQISAKLVAGQDLVVGKSMVLRRSVVDALDGFRDVANVLAEDFVIGQWVTRRMALRSVVARAPVYNVSQKKSVKTFFKRYVRWSIIHHTCIPTPLYLAQSILNPTPWALLGVMLSPSAQTLEAAGAVVGVKLMHDVAVFQMMRPGQRTRWVTVPAVLLKDMLLFAAWVNGLFARSVDWRGHSLRVMAGSRLVPPPSALPTPIPLPTPLAAAESENRGELLVG